MFDVHAILRKHEEQKRARAEQLPTEQDCLAVMQQAFHRLRELGWREAIYAPKDGRAFDAIEFGCAAILECQYLGEHVFAAEAGDLWPARPNLFRAAAALGKEQSQ
jgi:hypothetical protein